MSPLSRRMLDAYGGEATWRAARSVRARLSVGGVLLRSKRPLHSVWRDLNVLANVAEPKARLEPFDRFGRTLVLEGHDVSVVGRKGVVRARRSARDVFPGGRRALFWDELDVGYFLGYAMWNYLVLPALLLRDDVEWRDVSKSTLEARLPRHLPTHCEIQRFHVDPQTGLLRQHDYTAELFGQWARAAHLVIEHARADGLTYPSKRREKAGSPTSRTLIWIDLHDYDVLRRSDAQAS